MKTLFFFLLITPIYLLSQNIGIGTENPDPSAKLEITSDSSGILIPRMKIAQRNRIWVPATGLLIYNLDNRRFEYYDGTSWLPVSPATSDPAFKDEGGVISQKVNSGQDFIIGRDHLPQTGELVTDNLMFFDESKAAFRVGQLSNSNNWESDSIGNYSTAFGNNSIARGEGSIALGFLNKSLGNYSISMGSYSSATNTTSIALGNNCMASGRSSVAMGYFTDATANYSTSGGYLSRATGLYSIALGNNTRAIANSATALGESTLASGYAATALGYFTEASGYQSTSLGIFSRATGPGSFAIGRSSNASGDYSTAIGFASFAVGNDAIVIGKSLKAESLGEIVVGQFNNSYTPSSQSLFIETDRLFVIGNGRNSSFKSNAMVILKNGKTGIGTSSPLETLHLKGNLNIEGKDNDANLIMQSKIGTRNRIIVMQDNNANIYFGDLDGRNQDVIFRSNGTDRMIIKNNGNIGVGLSSPSYQLQLSSNSAAKPGSSSWTIISDRRLKQNIHAYQDGLNEILKINPVNFNYNKLSGNDTTVNYVGLIAQELQKVAPYMVTEQEDGYLTVDDGALTYMLINAVKELSKELQYEKEINKTLLNRIENIEAKLDSN